MTNADNPSRGTDWWTMNSDGSNQQRRSDFNSNGDARGFGNKQVWATTVQDADWSPDDDPRSRLRDDRLRRCGRIL